MSAWEPCESPTLRKLRVVYLDASPWAPEMNVGKLLAHRWPHPCYLGASYLNCGWSWIHECQEYGAVGEEVCQRWWRFACAVGKVPYLERAAYVRTYAEELYPCLCAQCSPDMACPYAICGRGRCIYPREDGGGCSLIA